MDIDEKKLLLAYGITQANSTVEAICALGDVEDAYRRVGYEAVRVLDKLMHTWLALYQNGWLGIGADIILDARAYITEHVAELDALIAERMPHGIAP